MTTTGPTLRLLCLASEAERDVMISAARQFADGVGRVLGHSWSLQLAFGGPDDAGDPADILVVSLLGEMTSGRPIAEIEAFWDRQLGQRCATPVVIPTIYRWVEDAARRAELAERCRRLNLVAVQLSRRHASDVADIDRAFALLGTSAVGSDYRCEGEAAALLAGHILAETLLGCDLSPHLPVEVQLQALAAHRKIPDPIAGGEEGTG